MPDPRNVAHGKKVAQEKKHAKTKAAAAGKKRSKKAKEPAAADIQSIEPATPETPKERIPAELERSVAVLSKLKDMEFHSRANVETLALLTLTIETELKQKEFSEPIGALYSAQDDFHSKIAALIASYEAKCESLRPPG
jgi:hypothetical protein